MSTRLICILICTQWVIGALCTEQLSERSTKTTQWAPRRSLGCECEVHFARIISGLCGPTSIEEKRLHTAAGCFFRVLLVETVVQKSKQVHAFSLSPWQRRPFCSPPTSALRSPSAPVSHRRPQVETHLLVSSWSVSHHATSLLSSCHPGLPAQTS